MLKETPAMNKKALLIAIPLIAMLTGCSQEIPLQGSGQDLANPNVTTANNVILYPDDNPSIADGKAVWAKMNCAECHGDAGSPVSGKATVDLTNAKYMAKQKPVDQYAFLMYGKQGVTHPTVKEKLSTRETWDLVFYSRSFASPLLEKAEWDAVDPVFGSNCAVCHGKKGFGDGPLAHNMQPVPANFHQFNRFYDRDDDTIYDHIANGILNAQGKPTYAGMPNFLNKEDKTKNVKFDEAYIRKLVAYVRQFHSSAAPTLAANDSAAKKQ